MASAFSVYSTSPKKPKKSKKSRKSDSETNGRTEEPSLTDKNEHEDEMRTEPLEDTMKVPTPKKEPKKAKLKKQRSSLENNAQSPVSSPKKKKISHVLDKDSTKSNGESIKSIVNSVNSASSTSEKAVKLLNWILYPMQVSNFFESHWESQPVHIIRNQPDYYRPLLSSKDIDIMLREHPLNFGRNVDIVEYKDGARQTMNPEGRATPSIVWDGYAQGYSVRILNPHTYNDTVHFVLATLQEYFGTMVGANIYLTPEGSQGFAPHYDDIEAFIIQLEGKKHWKLYKPLLDSDNLARFSSKDFSRDQLGELVFDKVLNAGDLLYFPRGMVHEAMTVPGEHSLHMTISSYQKTSYTDLMETLLPNALQVAAENDIDFRRGLPLNFLKHVGATSASKQTPERMQILKTVQKLFFKLAHSLDVDKAADAMGRKFMHNALPPVLDAAEKQCSSSLDGDRLDNGKIVNRIKLGINTKVRLVRYHACRFVQENDRGVVYFSTQNARVYHGEEEQFIETDLAFGVIIEILQLHYPDFVPIKIFPLEDKDQVLSFIMQLWDYGIVTTSKPAS